MARRPFFSGNYGSALGSTAQAADIIARAGQQRGQALAGMGAQIGGMIQQYGLNKEKRKKEEDTAMGFLAGMSPEELLQIRQENPQLGKTIEKAMSEQATPRDFQKINASAAPIMARQTRELDTRFKTAQIEGMEFKNAFEKADADNKLLRSTLENEGMQSINKLRDIQLEITEIERSLKSTEREFDRDNKYLDLEKKRTELESLRESLLTKTNQNSVFAELFEREKLKFQLEISETTSRLAINANKIDDLEANREIDSEIKEEQLQKLKAERKTIEQELTNNQELMNSFSLESDPKTDIDVMGDIDMKDAFQGDLPGYVLNTIGAVGGFFGSDLTPETKEQRQNIKSLNALLRPAMVSQLSSRPSNYTLKTIEEILPQPNDSDPVGKAKIQKLLPILQNRLKEALGTVKTRKYNTQYYQDAFNQAQLLPKIILKLNGALEQDTSNISDEEILKKFR